MGCDIWSYAEVRTGGGWRWARNLFPDRADENDRDEVFPEFDYRLFGFLADVRNRSRSPMIASARGLPGDVSLELRVEHDAWGCDVHHASWLTLAELLGYDYDQVFWDRRVTRDGDGAALAVAGEGAHLTLRDFLGRRYFERLAALAGLGDPADVRIVFWFDN